MELEKFIFTIQEIPEGESFREFSLGSGDLAFEDETELKGGDLSVRFYRTAHFIEIKFTLSVTVSLVCDRSLRKFDRDIQGSYHIVFEPDPVEEFETEKSAVKKIPTDSPVLNIRKEVMDTIILQIPAKKVHPEYLDASGNIIDFEIKTFGPPAADEEHIDPRWVALKKLK